MQTSVCVRAYGQHSMEVASATSRVPTIHNRPLSQVGRTSLSSYKGVF